MLLSSCSTWPIARRSAGCTAFSCSITFSFIFDVVCVFLALSARQICSHAWHCRRAHHTDKYTVAVMSGDMHTAGAMGAHRHEHCRCHGRTHTHTTTAMHLLTHKIICKITILI
jgi:hypothetical protein